LYRPITANRIPHAAHRKPLRLSSSAFSLHGKAREKSTDQAEEHRAKSIGFQRFSFLVPRGIEPHTAYRTPQTLTPSASQPFKIKDKRKKIKKA
jgi:hypothetical protein